jgi:hypothetical protein
LSSTGIEGANVAFTRLGALSSPLTMMAPLMGAVTTLRLRTQNRLYGPRTRRRRRSAREASYLHHYGRPMAMRVRLHFALPDLPLLRAHHF